MKSILRNLGKIAVGTALGFFLGIGFVNYKLHHDKQINPNFMNTCSYTDTNGFFKHIEFRRLLTWNESKMEENSDYLLSYFQFPWSRIPHRSDSDYDGDGKIDAIFTNDFLHNPFYRTGLFTRKGNYNQGENVKMVFDEADKELERLIPKCARAKTK